MFVLSGDGGGLLDNVELNVAVGGKVWGDSTMGSVGSSSSANGSLGGNVTDLAFLDIETLSLGVGLNVDEEGQNVLDGLGWVSTVVMVDVLAHSFSSWTTSVSSEWNDFLVLSNSFHVIDGLKKVHASAGSGGLIGVFVMSSQVIHSAFSGYKTLKSVQNNRLAELTANCHKNMVKQKSLNRS